MTTLSYTVPVAGSTLNSVADPEVSTALNSILTWANANIDTGNLSASAAIARSQLAGGFGNLNWSAVSTATNAVDGNFYQVTGAVTVTLPAPTKNRTVGVMNNVVGVVTVTASSGLIYGVGPTGAASITLGTNLAAVVLVADGTDWVIASGQQDTGWVALSLGTNYTVPGGTLTPAAKIVGNRVYLKGSPTTAVAETVVATVPSAAMFPSGTLVLGWVGTNSLYITSSGVITLNGAQAGQVGLDSLSYTLGT